MVPALREQPGTWPTPLEGADMVDRTLECRTCGVTYSVNHNRKSLYCSVRCRNRWQDKQPSRKSRPDRGMRPTQCGWCGAEFMTRNAAKACSPACRGEMTRANHRAADPPTSSVPWRECAWCGHWFISHNGSRWCSSPCRQWGSHPNLNRSTPISYGNCDKCGDLFIRRTGWLGRYCSTPCRKHAAKRDREHRKRTTTPSGEPVITLLEIAERDNWTCHLCGEKTNRQYRNGRDRDPTIDHLVPLSADGAHARVNVALAHMLCNTKRNTAGAAQLRLIA